MSKGIIYYVWGNYNKADLDRSIQSIKKFGYNYRVIVDKSEYDHLQKKLGIFESSPYDTTLFLDTDTRVLGNLDYGFEMAEKYKLACCIAPASSSYDAKPNDIQDIMETDLPQYNTGVLFFTRDAEKTFMRWKDLMIKHPVCRDNDQPYFSQAVYETINPYILPKTWNYRPHTNYESKVYHGELKILHSNRWKL